MHEKEIEIRWNDLDPFGHVNHAVFLTYLEEVRDEWLIGAMGGDTMDYVVARVEIDYRRELTLEDDRVTRAHPARLTGHVEHQHASRSSSSRAARRRPRQRPCSSPATRSTARARSLKWSAPRSRVRRIRG